MTITALHAKKKKALLVTVFFATMMAAGTIGAMEGLLYLLSSPREGPPHGTADPPRPMVTVLDDEVVIIDEYVGHH